MNIFGFFPFSVMIPVNEQQSAPLLIPSNAVLM
jgi:hypothetical protein